MKTKLLSAVLGLGLVFSLGACGNNKKEEKKGYDETVLSADAAGQTFHMVGGFEGKWAGSNDNKMTATSVAKVAEKSKDLADKLATKNLKYLYIMEGVHLGEGVFDMKDWTKTGDASGYSRFKAADGKIYHANNSYTIKSIRCNYVEDDDKYVADQWISDPKTAHAESLTDNIFFPTWQEKKDADGFAWNQNPVCTGGSGTYTVVVAQYKDISSAETFGFGFGLIKTNATEENPYEEEKQLVVENVSLIGEGVGDPSWGTDIDLTLTDGKWVKAGVEVVADKGFKVRVNHDWSVSFGYESLDENAKKLASDKGDGNIYLKAAGTYAFSVAVTVMGGIADAVISISQVN